MPPPNEQRRNALADAAIALLATSGVHGVTHREVERAAGLPTGTASNYHRSREALLLAAADRITELHHADMDRAARGVIGGTSDDGAAGPPHRSGTGTASEGVGTGRGDTAEVAAELIAGSLLAAATVHRARYLAVFELRLESRRRPALAERFEDLLGSSLRFTAGHHRDLDLAIAPDAMQMLVMLYGSVLFTLVSEPGEADPDTARSLARAVVRGAGLW